MHKIIPLIANSGIQFLETRINIDDNSPAYEQRSKFAEICTEIGPGEKEYEIIFPYLFRKRDKYIYRDSINKEAIDRKTGKIIDDDIKDGYVKYIEEKKGDVVYSIQARLSIETFEGAWLPLPYFRKKENNNVHPGPTSWARMLFSKIPSTEKKANDNATHHVVIAFDTRTVEKSPELAIPEDMDAEQGSVFVCPTSEDANFNFCGKDWVLEWLENEYEERKTRKTKYQFHHVAVYVNLLKVLHAANAFPAVSLHSINQFENKLSNEVDLILDIGNSRTCGLLYETTKINRPFKFTDAVPLLIRDLTYPNRKYSDPFEMQLAFAKANFGREILIPENIDAFRWTSLLRVGREATDLITKNIKTSSNISMSSPKRYLWDNRRAVFPWEFISDNLLDTKRVDLNGAIVDKLNDLFTADGVLLSKAIELAKIKGNEKPEMGTTPFFSRKSLMTFVYIEILLQALTFINSYEFRKKHGDEKVPRKLKRLVITCPTAMVQEERFYLRDLALDAVKTLSEIFGPEFIDRVDIEITPVPKEIKKLSQSDLDEDEKKLIKDWAYDEATTSQLTFLYGEIAHKYMNKTKLFFDINGKKRKKTLYPDQNSVCIASVDIGGGTTDMMICNYQTSPKDDAVIIPKPVFWEGFNIAGDDIIKQIVETLILPTIATEAKNLGCTDIVHVMSFLFGHDMQNHIDEDKMLRKQFASQIAMSMAYQFIQHAVNSKNSTSMPFKSFFYDYPPPNKILIKFINDNFIKYGAKNFDINNIKWSLNKESINAVVSRVVEKMLKQLSTVIAQYQCDFILLAGRPTTMPVIRDIFLKFLPAFADRIIQLGNYRIGRWYPFADAAGRIKDPKTCVAVGATISLMSKLGRLTGFRLETKYLKEEQKSTADFIGKYEKNENKISKIYLTPKQNHHIFLFNSPMFLGFKQLNTKEWIGTPLYKLDFASTEYAEKLNSRMPLKVEIEREYENNKELIPRIDSIIDNDGDDIPPGYLRLRLQTLPDEYGYWKDTGNFILPIF